MANLHSHALIQPSHPPPPLFLVPKSPPPTSRAPRFLNLLQNFTPEQEAMPLATLHSRPSSPNFVNGKLSSLRCKVQKFMHSFSYLSSRPPDFQQALLSIQHTYLLLDEIKVSTSGKNCNNGHAQPTNDTNLELFAAHEGRVLIKSPATAIVVTNALILSMPFAALAETCEADNSFFSMPLLLFVALVGATVGGLLARLRKGELQRVNEQLRQINAALRRQAKIESYAPTLSYAPVGGRIPDEVIVDPRKEELISRLKTGKNFLRNQELERAFVEFKAALDLAQMVKDPIEEKKAARGLGASLQRQGKYKDAIKYHSMVLAISDREGDDSGNTEAYGAIADCYTELGDLEKAGKFYDHYIARLEKD